jgi:carbon storage regulator
MLVLRRTSGEQLVIAGVIRITILQIRGNSIKIGIEAPLQTSILRGELVSQKPRLAKPSGEDQDASAAPGYPANSGN